MSGFWIITCKSSCNFSSINLGDLIAVLGSIDSVLGSVYLSNQRPLIVRLIWR